MKTSTVVDTAIRNSDCIDAVSSGDRILVVDDNHDILDMIAGMVRSLGYRSTTAPNGLDALDRLSEADHRLMITDYQMPLMDGYQLAVHVKRKYSLTRVIVMTTYMKKSFADMIENSAIVDGLLVKPFRLETLKEAIEKVRWAGPPPWMLQRP